jgi:hypothetical protein
MMENWIDELADGMYQDPDALARGIIPPRLRSTPRAEEIWASHGHNMTLQEYLDELIPPSMATAPPLNEDR